MTKSIKQELVDYVDRKEYYMSKTQDNEIETMVSDFAVFSQLFGDGIRYEKARLKIIEQIKSLIVQAEREAYKQGYDDAAGDGDGW